MKSRHVLTQISSALSISIVLGYSSATVQANPTGAEVINGSVSFSQPNSSTLQINNSNGSIINWQEFSINANETTHFQQSGANSAVLNQVVGSNGSQILGNLTSNGQVYLINQQGIVFGENAVVNTAGFIASTLNLSNQDFLEGRLNFEGVNAGDIVNQGFITTGLDGDIALIAPNIINEGVISVEQGDVILAAGEKVTLASLQASDVGFEIQSAENSVTNLGSITTDGGAVGMFAGSLTHSGVIEANALTLDASGNVMLIAKNDLTITDNAVISADGANGGRILVQSEIGTTLVSGSLSARGENGAGGVIDVLGNQVGIVDSAVVDASGTTAGGQVHIGGNYQGSGELQNASASFVGLNATIKADAVDAGDGGEIIVWADGSSRVHGSISATGGQYGGNGGFVETSGKQYLDVTAINLDVSAANGSAGHWLLDPFDLTISATPSDLSIGTAPNFSSTATGSHLYVVTLVDQLNAGTNVTIDTGATGLEAGNITIDDAINVTGTTPGSLTMDAANDIIINAAISSLAGPLNLTLTADSAKLDLSDNVGQIVFNASVNTSGGSVTLSAGNGIAFNTNGSVATAGGNLSAITSTGNINFAQTSLTAINAGAGDVILQADSITDNSLADMDIVANSLDFTTVNGFGTAAAAIRTSLNQLSGSNSSSGDVSLINNSDLTITTLNMLGTGITIINDGDLTVDTIEAGGADVVLDTSINNTNNITGGSILRAATATTTNINNAASVQLLSETGIGDSVSHFEVSNLTGLLNASVDGTGGIYIDNVGTGTNVYALGAFSTTSGDIFFRNLNVSQETNISGDWATATTGNINIESSSAINLNGTLSTNSAVSSISLSGPLINTGVASTITAVGTTDTYAVGLKADELTLSGTINAGAGDLALETLTDGTDIYLASAIDNLQAMDISQAEIDLMTAGRLSIGSQGMPTAGLGTNSIIFEGAINTNAMPTRFASEGDIVFNQGALTALTNTSAFGIELDTRSAIIDQSTGIDIQATNASMFAVNGVGTLDAIDTQLSGLSVINETSNDVNIINTGDISVSSSANSGGNLSIISDATLTVTSATDANGITGVSAASTLELQAANLIINGVLTASSIDLQAADLMVNAALTADAVLLTADELALTAAVNTGAGDVSIQTLTDGMDIYLASAVDNAGAIDISQAEIDFITAGRLSIGSQGVPAPGSGTNSIVFEGAIDTAAMATSFISQGDIVFNQAPGVTALTNTSATGVELNTLSAIVDQNTDTDIQATNLSMFAVNGIGSADAIDTQVSNLTVINETANSVNISNTGDVAVSASGNYGGDLMIASDGSVTITDTLTASANLSLQADTDGNGLGDVIFENLNGSLINVSAANIDISAASLILQADTAAVHVESAGLLNVVTTADLTVDGGSVDGADAYLSAQGNIDLAVAGNLSLTGGTAANTAASIFDVTNTDSNILTMTVGASVLLNAGSGDSSGAYVSAAEVNMMVAGNLALTGGAAANSPALIEATAGSLTLDLAGGLAKTAGSGLGSVADLVASIDVIINQDPVTNTAITAAVSTQNTALTGLDTTISASDTLLSSLDESLASVDSASQIEDTAEDEESNEAEPETQVLVCR